MKCDKCNSEWNAGSSVSKMTKCPFCGADLAPAVKGGTVTDLNTAVKRIIEMNGEDILRSKGKFTAMLGDIAPKLVTEKKFFDIALSENVGALFLDKSISHDECLTRVRNKLSVILNDSAMDAVTGSITVALGWENTPAAAPAETAPAPKAAKKTDEDQKPKTTETAVVKNKDANQSIKPPAPATVKKADAEQKPKLPAPPQKPKTPVPPKGSTAAVKSGGKKNGWIIVIVSVVLIIAVVIAVLYDIGEIGGSLESRDLKKLGEMTLVVHCSREEAKLYEEPDTSGSAKRFLLYGEQVSVTDYTNSRRSELMFKVKYGENEGYILACEIVPADMSVLNRTSFDTDEIWKWKSGMEISKPINKSDSPIITGKFNGKLFSAPTGGSVVLYNVTKSLEVESYAKSGSWYYIEFTENGEEYRGWVKSRDVLTS